MKTLSEQIKSCRDGAANNPFQGNDKKVLFVCSMGILRSATAARLYASKYNTRCAGTWDEALIPLTELLVEWADEIVFVSKANYQDAREKFPNNLKLYLQSRVLDIPDEFDHMHPELIATFRNQYE